MAVTHQGHGKRPKAPVADVLDRWPCVHRRIDYWHHITSSFLTTQSAVPIDRQKFCGRLTSLDLGDLRLVELAASGATLLRALERTLAALGRISICCAWF